MESCPNISDAPSIKAPLENSTTLEHEIDKDIIFKSEFNENIIIFRITKLSLPKKEYETTLTMEQFYKLNKIFVNFENSKDLVNWVIDSFKQKYSKVKFLDNNCIIQMTNTVTNKTFELNLNPKVKDINSRVSYLEAIIVEQDKKINEQNIKIISLEERLKKLETIITEYNEQKKKEKEEEKELLFDSEILNQENQEMLINWLPRKPCKINLLLNSKKDGDFIKTFINKSDGKSPTLAIIKTIDGKIFGGYTTKIWKEGPVRDENAFVFSVDNKKKYNILKPETAIGYSKNNFWLFGWDNNAFVIYDNCTRSNGNFVGNGTYDIPERGELNGGKLYFIVESFELHHIEY